LIRCKELPDPSNVNQKKLYVNDKYRLTFDKETFLKFQNLKKTMQANCSTMQGLLLMRAGAKNDDDVLSEDERTSSPLFGNRAKPRQVLDINKGGERAKRMITKRFGE
jgi:hypothetical protein